MGWGKAVAAGPLRSSANRTQGAKKQRQQAPWVKGKGGFMGQRKGGQVDKLHYQLHMAAKLSECELALTDSFLLPHTFQLYPRTPCPPTLSTLLPHCRKPNSQ